ncbi:MAG: chemotaxis protein CheX [Spirochaetota bacterium]
MDERLLSAFRSSAEGTFRDMFGIEAKAGKPVEISSNGEHGWDITGLLGMAGQVQGVFAFRLPGSLAEALLAKSGVEVGGDDQTSLASGLVGEITNIIAGTASSVEGGHEFDIAPPVVVRGPNHCIDWPNIGPVVAITFSTPDGSFEIDICAKT